MFVENIYSDRVLCEVFNEDTLYMIPACLYDSISTKTNSVLIRYHNQENIITNNKELFYEIVYLVVKQYEKNRFIGNNFIESYRYQYNLKMYEVVYSPLFVMDGNPTGIYYNSSFRRLNPIGSMIAMDSLNIPVSSVNNNKTWHRANDIMHIPEFIDNGRYVDHDIREFFNLDFEQYFDRINVDKKFKDLSSLDRLDLKNIKLWSYILQHSRIELFRDFNSNFSHLNVRNLYRQLVDNKTETVIKILNKFSNNYFNFSISLKYV